MTGPQRCRKSGPPRPIPPEPPRVEVLPPTDEATFQPPPQLLVVRTRFNAGDYRGCVEPIEELFFARRNTFHQGLLQYVVGVLQARAGLTSGPRRLLRGALELWEPYGDRQEGVDLALHREHARRQLAALEEDPPVWLPPPPL